MKNSILIAKLQELPDDVDICFMKYGSAVPITEIKAYDAVPQYGYAVPEAGIAGVIIYYHPVINSDSTKEEKDSAKPIVTLGGEILWN